MEITVRVLQGRPIERLFRARVFGIHFVSCNFLTRKKNSENHRLLAGGMMDWWQVHNHQAKIQDGQVVETWSRVTTGQYWTWIFNDAILRERRQDLSKPVLRISQVHSEGGRDPGIS